MTKVDNILIYPKDFRKNSSFLAIFVKTLRVKQDMTKGRFTYKFINNSLGWFAFAIATVTYILTLEPTLSLWDCGEFITTSYGLEVGHPPGAPLFMILGRFFSLFAPSAENVAFMINGLSALASGFCILFLFWTITHLAKKILTKKDSELSMGKTLAIMGAGLTGALAYTFSDTFWFSAVEAEVYALSSLFTAVVFWCILKWEDCANDKHSNRWLILITYLMGLSIGVHLLNLLAIPAIVFVYYFKKYKTTRKGLVYTSCISILILAAIIYGVIPGTVKLASWFELAFVNGMGLPFNSGVLFYTISLITAIILSVRYTHKHNKLIANTVILGFTMLMIGYSSYAMILVRSNANPPIDENNPDNVFSLLSYLNREQYGDRPLMFGQYYSAPTLETEENAPIYAKLDSTYKMVGRKTSRIYDSRFTTIFPRMYSSNPRHVKKYKQWGGTDGKKVSVEGRTVLIPSFANNMKFFFNYQLGHMYFRYFMWNFAGRQNDKQGHGELNRGNWISGIPFIDSIRLGNQDSITPEDRNDESRNVYFLFPLLFGLMGLLWHYKKDKKDFFVVLLLFFFTGFAIAIYLNQTPLQPRERDYAYAGSFYAFTIWIGLGCLAVFDRLNKKLNDKNAAIVAALASLLLVPTLMACQNWGDHDRSGRYLTLANAKNYLNSCEKDAILFTYGDNDTFPLWYAQEVEGVRRDIKVVIAGYLAGDWYITQMKRDFYKAKGLPISFKEKQYLTGTREAIPVYPKLDKAYDIKSILNFIKSDDKSNKLEYGDNKFYNYFPTKQVYFPVDSAFLINSGQVKAKDADKMLKRLDLTLDRDQYPKHALMVLDIIRENNWKRPVYFSIGMNKGDYLGLDKFFRLDGAAYKIVPFENEENKHYVLPSIDTDILYNNYINKFVWGRAKEKDVYIDRFHNYTLGVIRYKSTAYTLAQKLNDESKFTKAVEVLDKCLEELPVEKTEINNVLVNFASEYYRAGAIDKGDAINKKIVNNIYDKIIYYHSLSKEDYKLFEQEEAQNINAIKIIFSILQHYERKALLEVTQIKIESLYK
ncbi:MAG: DUF2723 domain-containing protein [Marinifilaceae bacterium]